MPDRPAGIGEPFARWSDMVRGSLVWLGCTDPVLTMDAAHEQDPSVRQRIQVFHSIYNAVGEAYMSATALIDATTTLPASTPAQTSTEKYQATTVLKSALAQVAERRGSLNAVALGKWFSANKAKIAGGRVLECEEDRHSKAMVWRVRKIFDSV